MTPTEFARGERAGARQRLREFVSIPSVSTVAAHAPDVRRAAEWVAGRLQVAGMDTVRIDETPGHPIVFAARRAADGRPTVLVYGHYDVQPPDPVAAWSSPPFEPTERGGALYGRGASDDKGQVLAHLEAAAAFHATGGCPVNVAFCIEGEEEVGSPNLAPWLSAHAAELAADVAVVSDTAIAARGRPSIVYGLRGLAYMELEVRGPRHDLHSGQFGGAVCNPANALAAIIAQLHGPGGRVAVPGFYDAVRTLGPDERQALAEVPFDQAAFDAATGAAGGWGEEGYTVIERLGARPTLDVNGLWSGWTGGGAKTVLPATAGAKISMRLVPDQDPTAIAALFTAYVQRLAPPGASVTVTALHGARPALLDRDCPGVRAAVAAYRAGFGQPPVFTLEGGSIPVVSELQAILGVDTVLMGFGLPDDNLHAPDEKFELAQLDAGIDTCVAFYQHYAEQWAAARAGGAA